MNEAQKLYLREFLPAMALFGTSVWISNIFLHRPGSGEARLWAALVPAIPMMLVIVAMIRRVERLDELQRRIELEAAVVAGLFVGMASFVVGFLVEAHLLQVSIIAVFPTMICVYAFAQAWAAWRYR